jgi:uncharacterized protein (TIGR02646 family)
MRKIYRSKVKPPSSICGHDSSGAKECEAAKEFYADAGNVEKTFPFKAYKHDSVKQALNDLFHNKCAYCESNIAATQPVDVEHFRPKGGVSVDIIEGEKLITILKKPGYYWLAADWKNLYPSCIDCNRARVQTFPDADPALAGKANKFPIANEKDRWDNPAEENEEDRLLLDPCLDFPERHLEFIEEGIVRPRRNSKGFSRKGRVSINLYGLNRTGLVQQRRGRYLLIQSQILRVRELIEELNEDPDDPKTLAKLKREMVILREFQREDQEYSEMARQYIQGFLETI